MCDEPRYHDDPLRMIESRDMVCSLGSLIYSDISCVSVCEDSPILGNMWDLKLCEWTRSNELCELMCEEGFSVVGVPENSLRCVNGSWDYLGQDSSSDWCLRDCRVPSRLGNGVQIKSDQHESCKAGGMITSGVVCEVECDPLFHQSIDDKSTGEMTQFSCDRGVYHDHNIYCSLTASYTITSQVHPLDGYLLIVLGFGFFLIPTSILCLCLKLHAESISFDSDEGLDALKTGRLDWCMRCVSQSSVAFNPVKTRICDVDIHTTQYKVRGSNKKLFRCAVAKIRAVSSTDSANCGTKMWRRSRVCQVLFNNKCICDNDNRKRSCFGTGLCWILCCCNESRTQNDVRRRRKLVKNRSNATWTTPLHVATIYGHVEIVELLLKHGADINDEDGKHKNVKW
jgi:hypothetical protein